MESVNSSFKLDERIPAISLTTTDVDVMAAQLVPLEMAQRYQLIPFRLKGEELHLAMADPYNQRAINDVRLYTGYEVRPYFCSLAEITDAIHRYLTLELSIARLTSREIAERSEFSSYVLRKDFSSTDAPTIQLVDSLLTEAIKSGASDIHWEPTAEDYRVRFRLDGELQTVNKLPLEGARSISARLKVMARMDVSERRLPQDGRCSIDVEGRLVDLRISSLPTVYGEKIVVRILDAHHSLRSLSELGMRPEMEQAIRRLLQNPHGLILVSGPTGSGKTTTLYAMVREIATESRNIVSIEDPVEYRLPGVNQVNVQPKIGLTFGRGLRAILRQDPDVIMIGEIRDEETARIAVSAALTGHLVLSTLHTNTAAEAITRLLDMGIEPYLLASALNAVISQRLVKRLCFRCKQEYTPSEVELKLFPKLSIATRLHRASGCPYCRGGYSGRLGIYELLPYDEEIKALILNSKSGAEIEQAAIAKGMIPLLNDGIHKVIQGLTTVHEVMKIRLAADG